MVIRYKLDANGERPDVFEAYDEAEELIGVSSVEERSCPLVWASRPKWITIRFSGEEEAQDALLGAAVAQGLYIARACGKNACIRVEREPEQEVPLALKALGFNQDSPMIRMMTDVNADVEQIPKPEGLTVVRDYLMDEDEQKYYLQRINAVFDLNRDEKWLDEVRKKPEFTRLLLLDSDGVAAEMITWADGKVGVVENIWVHQKWRRHSAGTFLLELARLYWKEKGLERARMDIWSRLQPAMRLAYRAGFQPAGNIGYYAYLDTQKQV